MDVQRMPKDEDQPDDDRRPATPLSPAEEAFQRKALGLMARIEEKLDKILKDQNQAF